MSCYFRHLAEIFKKAGIKVMPKNRKKLDAILHQLVDVTYKDCPKAWKRIKEEILSDSIKMELFVTRLKKAIKVSSP